MIFTNNIIFLAFGVTSLASQASAADCTTVESITCVPVSKAPTLDGNAADWSTVEVFEAPLTGALTSTPYANGDGHVKIQCVYDTERIYFFFQVPGAYRFSTEDNHKCASMSTMFKMGEDASLFNMGGCPLADAANCAEAPEECEDYKVDLGGHWELMTTEMGTLYGTNDLTGNDEAANKDDEYSVGPYCRFDDNDAKAANEWKGAWLHTSPVKIERVATVDAEAPGDYIFEMSRSLQTASDETDAQLEAGTAIDFGFAFWDPNELVETGWTDSGHFVTGCSKDWISLRLVDENGKVVEDTGEDVTANEGLNVEGEQETKSPASFAGVNAIYAFISSVFVTVFAAN